MISVTLQFSVRHWKEWEDVTVWCTQITNHMLEVWDSLPLQLQIDFIFSVLKGEKKKSAYLTTNFIVAESLVFIVIFLMSSE